MPARINLIGQRFEKLTVIALSDKKQDNKRMWECQCDCGNTTYALTRDLRNGRRKSCGCLHKDMSKAISQSVENRKNKMKEKWIGSKHGFLVVLALDETKTDKERWWICKCENCGSIKSYRNSNLYTTQSCGCINSKGEEKVAKILIDNNIPFVKQKTFEDLIGENGQKYRYDFYVNNQYLVEYDGNIHFMCTTGWSNKEKLEEIQKRDKIKNGYAKENNIPLIRIPYTAYEDLELKDLLLETSNFLVKERSGDLSE